MEPGPLRRLATLGMLAVIACLVMYLFAAKQVTDTETPRVAQMVHRVLERNLVEGQRTQLKLITRDADDSRHYEMRLWPAERVASDGEALGKLLRTAATVAVSELAGKKREMTLTCVAVSPAGETRVTYDRGMQVVPEPDIAPPPPDGATE